MQQNPFLTRTELAYAFRLKSEEVANLNPDIGYGLIRGHPPRFSNNVGEQSNAQNAKTNTRTGTFLQVADAKAKQ